MQRRQQWSGVQKVHPTLFMQQPDIVAVDEATCSRRHPQQVLNHHSRGGDGGGASDDAVSSHHLSHHPAKWHQENVRIRDKDSILFYSIFSIWIVFLRFMQSLEKQKFP